MIKDCEERSQILRSSSVGWKNGLKEIWWSSVETKCKSCLLLGLKHAWASQVGSWLAKRQSGRQCSLAAKEANCTLDCISMNRAITAREGILYLALARLHMSTAFRLGSYHQDRYWNTGVSPTEGSQGRKRTEEKLRELCLLSFQRRKDLRGNLITLYN